MIIKRQSFFDILQVFCNAYYKIHTQKKKKKKNAHTFCFHPIYYMLKTYLRETVKAEWSCLVFFYFCFFFLTFKEL